MRLVCLHVWIKALQTLPAYFADLRIQAAQEFLFISRSYIMKRQLGMFKVVWFVSVRTLISLKGSICIRQTFTRYRNHINFRSLASSVSIRFPSCFVMLNTQIAHSHRHVHRCTIEISTKYFKACGPQKYQQRFRGA